MDIGLVGFPGSGKSTVFNALTGLSVETGYGAGARKTHLGVVKVPDPRVDALSAIYHPKKTVYAEVRFSDVPGGTGRSLERRTLDALREVDALCQVLRAFHDEASPAPPDPLGELRDLEAELVLADLDLVEKRVARMTREQGNPVELALLRRLQEHLEGGHCLRRVELGPDERRLLGNYQFLSDKPLLPVLNVDEADVAAPVPADVGVAAAARGLSPILLSARVEMDIAQLPAEEQAEFVASLGLAEPARDRFLRAAFDLLDLVSMLTVGDDECRAWPVRRGTKAPRAAGKIHSDIERGFIRAAVIDYHDLIELGSEPKCREAGKERVEGKDYVIADGDVVHFRFNV